MSIEHEKYMQRTIFNEETLRAHLEKEQNVQWIELKDLLAEVHESCVDGRGDKGIIGVPGGNAGEFVLAISTYEDLTKVKLNDSQIKEAFKRYLEKYGKFYFHSDTHALEHMKLSEEELRNPPEDKREEILRKITDPENIGCGHLKLSAKDPEKYGMRNEIMQVMIRTFFEELWEGNEELDFTVLEGGHKEGAVVIVKVDVKDDDINGETKIPIVYPNVGQLGTQAFVYHPQAVEFLRKEIASGINEVAGAEAQVDVEEFAKKMIEKGNNQLGLTVDTLAKDEQGSPLPKFEVIFDNEGKIKSIQKN
ncbi:hypothetical protein A2257_02735 [Candidatus Falkowbacteria bacterium RIFOXYA2_FULL_38_12]|uniref:Uncharacterized protein n=1 Tax=Candidatus Falkowbacteria bacterium RIFOXYA2_FULL_38_12 TaxID=1797993 RepID=A0A1F5S4E7_9BACT|nr:MAG: hypothetical protein A2257_02735 [Candidatus Falkowbacteria bacterium RIFOXYA2_FULL_38_12]OGF42404.1 MAG: hypothetical protein A2555_00455 [Candidatus Falkowbacteria bacterium RIFOXYD2_FULL_39_16]